MTSPKVGQRWKRRSDGSIIEIVSVDQAIYNPYGDDIRYRRVGGQFSKRGGHSRVYALNLSQKYELIEENS